jgi:hypothetical protein
MVEIGVVGCRLFVCARFSIDLNHLNTIAASFLGGLKVSQNGRPSLTFCWVDPARSRHSTFASWGLHQIGGGPFLIMRPGVFLPDLTFPAQRSESDLPDSDCHVACSILSVWLGLVRLDLPRHYPVAYNNSLAIFSF